MTMKAQMLLGTTIRMAGNAPTHLGNINQLATHGLVKVLETGRISAGAQMSFVKAAGRQEMHGLTRAKSSGSLDGANQLSETRTYSAK